MSFVDRLDKAGARFGQGLKSAWYIGHYMAALRMGGSVLDLDADKRLVTKRKMPKQEELFRAIGDVLERDRRNQEQGVYTSAESSASELLSSAKRSLAFLKDVPKVDRRRREEKRTEVREEYDASNFYPAYYLQNFHYQTDGYLSEDSAEIYDFQVETLFSGTAGAMRRQALVPVTEFVRGKDQRKLSLLDVACGTGSFLSSLKLTYPRLGVTALDLSPFYLDKAKVALKDWTRTDFVHANAEHIPAEDGAFDIITCVYLFHELPPEVRPIVAREIARVLKSGGIYVHTDTLQLGDYPQFDGLLDLFPRAVHEPYYATYVQEDLGDLFAPYGLVKKSDENAFLTKVSVFSKQET